MGSRPRGRLPVLALLGAGLAGAAAAGAGPAQPDLALGLDLATGRLLIRRDHRSYRGPLPIGSLVKPFTIAAYARRHALAAAPTVTCPAGGPPGCWYPPGHGVLGLEAALGQSCNSYFRILAREVDPVDFRAVLREFGLPEPPDGEADPHLAMVGLDAGHRMDPPGVLAAFAALVGNGGLWVPARAAPIYRGTPRVPGPVRELLAAGMARGAREGTTQGAGVDGLEVAFAAKTGTAAALRADGSVDPLATAGWFVGLAPAGAPRVAVLAWFAKGTGSHDAAPAGGRLLAEALRRVPARP